MSFRWRNRVPTSSKTRTGRECLQSFEHGCCDEIPCHQAAQMSKKAQKAPENNDFGKIRPSPVAGQDASHSQTKAGLCHFLLWPPRPILLFLAQFKPKAKKEEPAPAPSEATAEAKAAPRRRGEDVPHFMHEITPQQANRSVSSSLAVVGHAFQTQSPSELLPSVSVVLTTTLMLKLPSLELPETAGQLALAGRPLWAECRAKSGR